MLLIDKYAYTNRLRNFNPMAKFFFAIGILILSLNMRDYRFNLCIFLFLLILTVGVAGIPFKKYTKLLCIPIAFLIVSLITILISCSPKRELFLWALPLSKNYIGITRDAIVTCRHVFFRAMACVAATYFMALTIPMNQLIVVFKKFRLPKVFIELLILIYRFIFIFLEECKEIHTAQEMRFGYNNRKNSYKSLSLLIRCLFVRVMLKYEELIISLESKLYDGEFKM